jgi:hypothetical protein
LEEPSSLVEKKLRQWRDQGNGYGTMVGRECANDHEH